MAMNRRDKYTGDSLPAVTPIKPAQIVVRSTVVVSQADYDAIVTKDPGVLYLIRA